MIGFGQLRRLQTELTTTVTPGGVASVLARLYVVRDADGGAHVVLRDARRNAEDASDGENAFPFASAGPRAFGALRFERGVYASIPTRQARRSVLTHASKAARDDVSVHIVTTDTSTHLGRLVIDTPRRMLSRLGVPTAEPGDRFADHSYSHGFFDEEGLLDEFAEAGLRVVLREGAVFTLRRSGGGVDVPRETPAPFATELVRAMRLWGEVERLRHDASPREAVERMRARGKRAATRGPIGRARLRRAIGWLDAPHPRCFRRVLLECGLDAGAAGESLIFGLNVGRTGHVAFVNREEQAFDVSFVIPGDTPVIPGDTPVIPGDTPTPKRP